MRRALTLAIVVIGAAIPLGGVVDVYAAEVSRPEYVAHAEPICKTNATANRHIFRGIRNDVREGKLEIASRKFKRAAKALDRTVNRLEALPKPSDDESRLARWFNYLDRETKLLERIAMRLQAKGSKGLEHYVLELRHNANVANNIVLTFGFEYCLLQPARYV